MNPANLVPCPHCGGPLEMVPELAGQDVICPHCSQQFTLPGENPQPIPRAAPVQPVPQNFDEAAYQDDDFGLAPAAYQQYSGLLPPAAPVSNIPQAQAVNPTPAAAPAPPPEVMKKIQKRKQKKARRDEVEFDSPMLQQQVEAAKREARLQRSTGSDGGLVGRIVGTAMAVIALIGVGWFAIVVGIPNLLIAMGTPEGLVYAMSVNLEDRIELLEQIDNASSARQVKSRLYANLKEYEKLSRWSLDLDQVRISHARKAAFEGAVRNQIRPLSNQASQELNRISRINDPALQQFLRQFLSELDRIDREIEMELKRRNNTR